MEETSDFFNTLGDFFKETGQVLWDGLVVIGAWLQIFFIWLTETVSNWVSGLNLPMLPSVSKIFQEDGISGTILAIIAGYIIIINMVSFQMFFVDKQRAKKNRKDQRISERSLLSVCFWGGALGGFLGMKLTHHKTQHKKFTIGVTIMLICQALIFSFLAGFFGFWVYLS